MYASMHACAYMRKHARAKIHANTQVSCTVTTQGVFDLLEGSGSNAAVSYFRDVSTFGSCTGGPAAALANLEIIEREKLVTNLRLMGSVLTKRLQGLRNKYPVIGDVRGKGLFQGLELVKDRASKAPVSEMVLGGIVADCMEQGVLLGRTNRAFVDLNNNLYIAPPLMSSEDDIHQIVDAVDAALARLARLRAAGRTA